MRACVCARARVKVMDGRGALPSLLIAVPEDSKSVGYRNAFEIHANCK